MELLALKSVYAPCTHPHTHAPRVIRGGGKMAYEDSEGWGIATEKRTTLTSSLIVVTDPFYLPKLWKALNPSSPKKQQIFADLVRRHSSYLLSVSLTYIWFREISFISFLFVHSIVFFISCMASHCLRFEREKKSLI
jgi:hypothetical protein